MNDQILQPDPRALGEAVRKVLVEAGHTLLDEPAHSIPARYWPTPDAYVLGYLDVSTTSENGALVSYEMTFREAPLGNDRPKLDLRFEFPQEDDRG